jgi:hypothetical protein
MMPMAMRQRDFEFVASSIARMRSQVQTDLDRRYAENGAVVLNRLTEQLAEDCAARYPRLEREAFLRTSWGLSEADTRSFEGFVEAKSATIQELDRSSN